VLWLIDIVFGGSVSLGGFIPVTLLVIALLVSRAGVRRLLKGPTPGLKCAPAGPGDDGLANARICRCRGGFARPCRAERALSVPRSHRLRDDSNTFAVAASPSRSHDRLRVRSVDNVTCRDALAVRRGVCPTSGPWRGQAVARDAVLEGPPAGRSASAHGLRARLAVEPHLGGALSAKRTHAWTSRWRPASTALLYARSPNANRACRSACSRRESSGT
jgi:hypothetical protein